MRATAASHVTCGQGYMLTADAIAYYRGHYIPDPAQWDDWRASPLRRPDLQGLPPALVLTAGFDPLRDEGRAYADRLSEAGNRAQYVCFEQSDLIVAIGEWMLEAVAAQMARWQAQGRGWLPVAVNLGARHFGDPHLPERLARLRERHGLPEGVLELEITESTLMEVGAEPQRLLGDLRRAGMRLSIDDFGTGYSSLSYLKMLPVDALKIDRSFVHGIESDPRDLNSSSTIVAMAHGFGLRVIAEGVETEGQRALLERLGCDEGQGWLFARPMPAAEFEAWWQVWAPQPA